ncbi:MAG: hypothetical protein NFW30_05625, partial [Candidatus Accumulibacter sp.]|nr:hypothetical protein [Accumulibacter sp.]
SRDERAPQPSGRGRRNSNMPLISEITPLLIISKLEQYDVVGATALAVVMLFISFLMLFVVNGLQWWAANRHGARAAGGGLS